MQLILNCFGSFQAIWHNVPIVQSKAKKIKALLIYLAIEANRTHERKTLSGLLFPDMPDEMAQVNLRQTLTRLRRALEGDQTEPPFILVTHETTQFNQASDYRLDVALFREGVGGCARHRGRRNGRCPACMALAATAVSYYKGPFLDGFYLEDSSAFDEWVLNYRQQFQALALSALEELANYHERRGEYSLAEQYAQQQLQIEPWHEPAQRQMLRTMAYQGRRNAALAAYKSYCKQLWQELGVKPMPETAVLVERITLASSERPYHLPPREQSFVGRSEELAQLSERLADPDQRLLALVGPGGIGKTRLVLELAWQAATAYLGPFMHGVYFVPLAGVASVEQEQIERGFNPLVTAVADALGYSFAGSGDPQTQLIQYLQNKTILLVLDNLEHQILASRALILALLPKTSGLKIVFTSRERLHLPEEWVLELDGLPLSIGEDTAVAPAVQLFVQRAQQIDARFQAQPGGECTPADTAQICRLLYGIPLAIELAAAWVRLMTCPEIVAEIRHNLGALALSSSTPQTPARHRSLRAVFDYSWQLLTPDEQHALLRLAVFQGSFDRQAALTVAQASLPQLASLLDKSFLRRHLQNPEETAVGPAAGRPTAGRPVAGPNPVARYELLPVMRQFAVERLQAEDPAHPSTAAALHQRHSQHYLGFIAAREVALQEGGQRQALAEINQEIENVRAAWRWAVAQADIAGLDKAIGALSLFFYMRSWFSEGKDLCGQAISRLQALPEATQAAQPNYQQTLAKLETSTGWFAFLLGEQEMGQKWLEMSVQRLRPLNQPLTLAYALNFLAVVTYTRGHYQAARILCQEALALGQASRNRYSQAISNNILSQIAYLLAEYDLAQVHSQTSLKLERALGNQWSMGFSLANLGRVAYARGHYAAAQAHFGQSLTIREEMRDARGQGLCQLYLGDTAVAQGNPLAAEAHYLAGLSIFKQIGNQTPIAMLLTRLGRAYQQQSRPGEAWDCLQEALRHAIHGEIVAEQLAALASLGELLQSIDPALAQPLLALGKQLAAAPDYHPGLAQWLEKVLSMERPFAPLAT